MILRTAVVVFLHSLLTIPAFAAPTITSISPSSGPIGTLVTISGSGFGTTQGSSTVALNGVSAAVTGWNDGSITGVVPSGASSGPFSVTVGGQTANSSIFTVTALPSGWSQSDIGSVGVNGSGSYANGTFTVQGGGQIIYYTADAFHFVYQSLPGDWTIVARVASVQGNSSNGAAGVMIRETLDPGATNAKTADWPYYSGIYFDVRTTTGGGTSEPGGKSATLPYWVKVVRSGSNFSGYLAPDGVNWTQVGTTQTISMAENVYVGLAVNSGSTSALAIATFDNVSLVVGPPVINSLSPVSGEPGSTINIQGNNFTSATGSVTFNGQTATVSSWSNTSIQVVVPNGVASGNVVVTAGTQSSNGVWFGPLRPAIAGISPVAGNPGDSIRISGNYFGNSMGTVSFNGQAASISSWLDRSITVTLPANATTGNVVVSNGGLQSNGLNFIVGPFIANANPASGNSGTSVTLNGFNFGNSFGGVTFNGQAASGSSWTSGSIATTVPANATSGPVLVTTAGGLQTASGPIFVVPTVNGVFGETDIGTVAAAGSTSVSGSAYTVSAYSGKLGGTADSLHYLYEPANGDFDMIARATVQTTSDSHLQYGITARDSFAPGGVTFSCLGQSNNAVAVASRTSLNGTGTNSVGGIGAVSPLWLRLRRYANTFQCLYSSDGNTWTQYQSGVAPVSSQAMVGLSLMSDNQTLAQVVFDNVSLANANTPPPSPWLQQDMGAVTAAGDATYNNGIFTISSNSSGFYASNGSYTTADSVHYVYQPVSGDFDFRARWQQVVGDSYMQAGLMVRQSLDPTDLQASCIVQANGSASVITATRSVVGTADQLGGGSGSSSPNWVRITRFGSLFSCYTSNDGSNWVLGSSFELNISPNVYVGLAQSDRFGRFTVATFDSVTVSGVAGLPGPWQQQDIGSVTAPGDASLSNNIFTVESNSYDIAGTADSLHYVYQQASGDLNLIAQVSWQNYVDLPKAGVMVRQSLGASDLQFSCLTDAAGRVDALWRSSSGAADQVTQWSSSNLWVKINRHGNSFTCYASADGSTWTQVANATVNMGADVYAGLAQASVYGRYALGTFSNANLQANIATVSITYPIGGSTVYLSQPVVLTANAMASPGATVANVQYFEGQNPLGQATTPPYSLNIGAPSKGNHTYAAVVTDSTGLQASSFPVTAILSNPQVTGVSPNHGKAGTLVKINGIGFGSSPTGVQVNFNGVPGFMTEFGDGEMGVIVPSGSGTGPMGIQWPDGVGADGAPASFGPCEPNQGCVTDFIVLPAVVVADGQHTVMATATTNSPGAAVSVGQVAGGGLLACSGSQPTTSCIGNAASCKVDGSTTVTFSGTPSPVTGTQFVQLFAAITGGLFFCNDPNIDANLTLLANGQANGWPDLGPCTDCAQAGKPINVKTGNTYIQTGDYSLPGLGGGISINRTWNSQWSNTGPLVQAGMFGDSWRASYEDRIQATSGGVNYWLDDGKVWRFTNNNGTYTLASPVDARGTLSFDAGAGLYTLTFVSGARKIFGVNGYLQQVVDRNGNTTTVNHDTSNRIVQITDPANRTLSFSYGDANHPNQATAMQDATGVIASYGYDSSSRLIHATFADNSQINYTYDSNGLITSVTDALGKVLEAHSYDSQRRGLSSQLANGVEEVSVSYPQAGLSKTVDSGGNSSSYGYTQLGEKTFVTSVSGPGCASCGIRGFNQYTYDASGNVLASFDSNGVPTLFTYDGNGNVTSRSTPVNNHLVTWQYSYNSLGELLTATDPLGNVSANTYDANGNLLTTTTPAPDSSTSSSVTTFAYDAKGELTSITDPLNHTTTLAYYPTGLLHTVTDAQNNVTTFNYDPRGNRTDVYDALNQHTSFTYDSRNRLTGITNPDSSTVAFAYDTRGRRTSVTDGNGKVTQYAYDDADRLVSVTDANNHVTQYAYDLENNLTGITDANNHVTSFSYDTQGRLTQTTFPSGKAEKYTYDNVGNLMTKIDRKNQTISYAYDTLNRLLGKIYPDSSSVNYSYDDAGRLAQVQDGSGTYSFAYDNMGRLKQVSSAYAFLSGNPFTVVYGYDAASNRTSLTGPCSTAAPGCGPMNTYTYDTLNRLTSILDFNNNNFSFGYDALSRRTHLTRPNGITTNYGYDVVSNLLSVLHQQGASTLDGASYTYDSAGNRKSKTNLLNSITSNFSYDNVYQLTGVTGPNPESYSYDAVGNRLTSQTVLNYAYNSSNELTAAGLSSYTYDDNGNTLTKTDSTGTSAYTWDFENRLTSVQLPNNTVVTFKYDPFGRRIQKSSTSTTNYVYDEANVIEEVDQSGNLLARYSRGAGIDEPLSELRAGATSYYEQDGLGSVTSLSSTGGTVANTYLYDSFGNLSSSSGTITNPYQYTGRDYDPETGLRYYRARYYDSATSRFLSEDPLGFAGAVNFYPYADNSPTNFSDPFGLQAVPKPTPTPTPPSQSNALPWPIPATPPAPIPFPQPQPEYGLCARFPILCALWMPFIPLNSGENVHCWDELDPRCPNQRPLPKPEQACKSKHTEEECEEMYATDTKFCSSLRNPRDRAACRAQASERYANCLAGRQIPPLPWRRPN